LDVERWTVLWGRDHGKAGTAGVAPRAWLKKKSFERKKRVMVSCGVDPFGAACKKKLKKSRREEILETKRISLQNGRNSQK